MTTEFNRRVSYDLSFKRANQPRQITFYGLTGDLIDDAEDERKVTSGEWMAAEFLDESASNDELLSHGFECAIHEAVHEALEWFKVDGKPLIDPHDRGIEVHHAVDKLVVDLFAMVDIEKLWEEGQNGTHT